MVKPGDELGPLTQLTRFALFDMQETGSRHRPAVGLLIETTNGDGDVEQIEMVKVPADAVRNGNALVDIGTTLQKDRLQ